MRSRYHWGRVHVLERSADGVLASESDCSKVESESESVHGRAEDSEAAVVFMIEELTALEIGDSVLESDRVVGTAVVVAAGESVHG